MNAIDSLAQLGGMQFGGTSFGKAVLTSGLSGGLRVRNSLKLSTRLGACTQQHKTARP
jgi:hypothetical protein